MDYNRLAQRVVSRIAEYGRDIVLRQYPTGSTSYDPTNLTVDTSAVTPVVTTLKGLVTDQPGKRIGPQYGTNMKHGSLIEDGQKWIYINGTGPKPRPNDKVILDSIEYTIDDVQETAPGGVVLLYLLVLYR